MDFHKSYYDVVSISLNLLAMVLSDAKIPFVSEEMALSRAFNFILNFLSISALDLSLISDTREESSLATLLFISFACLILY